MNKVQDVIVVEGYDDRAFLAGWLEYLGCRALRGSPDPWGRTIKGGKFGYESPSEGFIKLVPTGSKGNLVKGAHDHIKEAQRYDTRTIVVVTDADLPADKPDPGLTSGEQRIAQIRQSAESRGFEVPQLASLVWAAAPQENHPGVPNLQTLERLACLALVRAHPDRASPVEEWLDAEPKDDIGPKNYRLSYVAKWYANDGADHFWRALWEDQPVREELEKELADQKKVIEDLMTPPKSAS